MSYTELIKEFSGVMAGQIVMKRFEDYTKKEVKNIKLSYDIQGILGHPTDRMDRT